MQKGVMMASKQKTAAAKPEGKEPPRKEVHCEDGETREERGRRYAALLTSPELAAFRVVRVAENNYDMEKHIDVPTLVETLREQAKAVNRNDLAKAEAMLMNQATALQSLFARLSEKAFSSGLLPQFEAFMRMALRAQNQCRATLETLSTIKNPPVVIAKQANFANGYQQVNNGAAMPVTHAQAGENKIQQNELLTEVQHGKAMDISAASAASRANPAMETVGKIHGS